MGRAERDFHQLEAQIRRLLVVLEGPELERRLRHDRHFPGNVAASAADDVGADDVDGVVEDVDGLLVDVGDVFRRRSFRGSLECDVTGAVATKFSFVLALRNEPEKIIIYNFLMTSCGELLNGHDAIQATQDSSFDTALIYPKA